MTARMGTAVADSHWGARPSEAAAALAVLGYSSQEISAALKGVDADICLLEEMIQHCPEKDGHAEARRTKENEA